MKGYNGERVAVYTGTRNLYKLMVPAFKSLLLHTYVDKIYLFIEDDEFPYELPKQVEIRNVSKQEYFKADGPNMKSRFTYMALMRAALAKEFPELDRILSLDVDTIVNDDISDIWNLPLDDYYYFSASMEPQRTWMEGYFYTNIGVALYNLKKLRDDKKVDEVIEALNTKIYPYMEQDAFNEMCKGQILDMPSMYNANDFTKPTTRILISHYAGMRNWSEVQAIKDYTKLPYEDIEKYRKRTGRESLEMTSDNKEKKLLKKLLNDRLRDYIRANNGDEGEGFKELLEEYQLTEKEFKTYTNSR